MSSAIRNITFFINDVEFSIPHPEQAAEALKLLVGMSTGHVLARLKQAPGCEDDHEVIGHHESIRVESGDRFLCEILEKLPVTVLINRKPYRFKDRHQTGHSLKVRAGIPSEDVLFLDRPHEDVVIPDDHHITLHEGQHFHSSPPANYGKGLVDPDEVGFPQFHELAKSGGWTWLMIENYPLPACYAPAAVTLLIQLPPQFPDAAPDMFWVSPTVRTTSGVVPHGTGEVNLEGQAWQQFSWHLKPGAWQPGISSLRDYLRCVRARFEKHN